MSAPKAVKDSADHKVADADHKVTDTGYFATKHISKCLLPKLVFINFSFDCRVKESMFDTNALSNSV